MTVGARQAAGRPEATATRTDAASTARSSLKRKDTVPWPSPGPGKSDQTLAGLLARGSQLDARPSQASQDLASGPVAGGPGNAGPHMYIALATYSCRDSRGIEQRKSRSHRVPILIPSRGTGAIMSWRRRDPTVWTGRP